MRVEAVLHKVRHEHIAVPESDADLRELVRMMFIEDLHRLSGD